MKTAFGGSVLCEFLSIGGCHVNAKLIAFLLCTALAASFPNARGGELPPRYRVYLDGPWGQIHVRVEGKNQNPTIVLVHQMIWSSDQFRYAQTELSARGIRSIAIDLPGYGMSDGPPTPPTADQYAEVLVSVLKHFGLKSTNLLGVNEGATIACAFASAHPNMVKTLTLDGPPIFNIVTQAKYFSQPRAYREPRADGSHLQIFWKRETDTVGTKLTLTGVQANLMSVFGAGPNGWFAQDAVYRYDLAPVLRRLKVPVMILTYPGQQFHQAALDIAAERLDFTLRTLNWQGLVASFDAPEPWAESVASFLNAQK